MTPAVAIFLALGLGLVGWLAARAKAVAFRRESGARALAALPGYHGWYVAVWTAVPAVLFASVWSVVSQELILARVLADPAAAALPSFGFARDAVLAEARALAAGQISVGFNPQS